MDGFIFWRFAHPIVASAPSPNDPLNTITASLLVVLAVALLLLALAAFFSYSRTSRQSSQAQGRAPRRAQRNVSAIASIMLAVPVVWLLVVWGGTSAGQPTPTPTVKPGKMTPTPRPNPTVTLASELVTHGMFTVGTDTNNPPQEFLDPNNNNQPAGFDLDLITDIAHQLGLQPKIVRKTGFNALITGLKARQFDVVISAISETPVLETKFDFVSYLHASESLLVQTNNPKGIKGLTDLCGRSVGVQDGSTEQLELQSANTNCTTARKPDIKVTTKTSETEVIQLLLAGTVDATYQDTSFSDYYMQQNPGGFVVAGVTSTPDEGIVIRKGDAVMLKAVQAAFNQLKQDGTYGSLITKWSLTNEAIAEIDRRSGVV